MRLTPFVLAAALVTTVSAAPATAAAKRKPINKSYEATAATPDPTNLLELNGYTVCAMNVPGSFHTHSVKVLGAGKFSITLSNYVGDWDMLLLDSKGTQINSGEEIGVGTPATPAVEVISQKIRKAGTYTIVACNWAGGPTASVKYTYTYS